MTTSERIRYTGFANRKPSSKPTAAPTAAATSRTAKKSSGVRLPGRPARSSLFMRSCRAFCGVEREGKERDQGSGRPRLRGQGCDLALDAHALADGVSNVVEYLRQVAADRAVDRVGRRDQVEVGAGDALGDVLQRLIG